DLAPKPAKSLAMNACQNAAMTELVACAGEIPAQNLPFALELRQGNVDVGLRQAQALRYRGRGKRADAVGPAAQDCQRITDAIETFCGYPMFGVGRGRPT